MTSDSDYSIRRTSGTGEIVSYHAISDREGEDRPSRKDKKKNRREDGEPEAAVRVELSEDTEARTPPQDAEPPEHHEVDFLA